MRTRATEAAKRSKRMQRAREKRSKSAVSPNPVCADNTGPTVGELAAEAAALRITERPMQTQPSSSPLPSAARVSAASSTPASKKKKKKMRPRMRRALKARKLPNETQTPAPLAQNNAAERLYLKVVDFWRANSVDDAALVRAWRDPPAKVTGMLLTIPSNLSRLLTEKTFFEKQVGACITVLRQRIKPVNPPDGTQIPAPTSVADMTTVTPLPTEAQLSAALPEVWRRLVGKHLYARVKGLVADLRDVEGLVSSGSLSGKITGMLLDCADRRRVEASLRDSQMLRRDFDRAVEVLRRALHSNARAVTTSATSSEQIETRATESPSVGSGCDSPQYEERTVGSLTFTVVPPLKPIEHSRGSQIINGDEPGDPTLRAKPTLSTTTTVMLPTPTQVPASSPTPQTTSTPTSQTAVVCSECDPGGNWMSSLQLLQCRLCGRDNANCQTLEDAKADVGENFSTSMVEMLDTVGKASWMEVCSVSRKKHCCF